eukprot:7032080-Lingulodinium_polyedra.AAC.1
MRRGVGGSGGSLAERPVRSRHALACLVWSRHSGPWRPRPRGGRHGERGRGQAGQARPGLPV